MRILLPVLLLSSILTVSDYEKYSFHDYAFAKFIGSYGDHVLVRQNLFSTNASILFSLVNFPDSRQGVVIASDTITGNDVWSINVAPLASVQLFALFYDDCSTKLYVAGTSQNPSKLPGSSRTTNDNTCYFIAVINSSGTIDNYIIIQQASPIFVNLNEGDLISDSQGYMYLGTSNQYEPLIVKINMTSGEEIWRRTTQLWSAGIAGNLIQRLVFDKTTQIVYVVGIVKSSLSSLGLAISKISTSGDVINFSIFAQSSVYLRTVSAWLGNDRFYISCETTSSIDHVPLIGVKNSVLISMKKVGLDERKVFIYGSTGEDTSSGCCFDSSRNATFCSYAGARSYIKIVLVDDNGNLQTIDQIISGSSSNSVVVDFSVCDFSKGLIAFAVSSSSGIVVQGFSIDSRFVLQLAYRKLFSTAPLNFPPLKISTYSSSQETTYSLSTTLINSAVNVFLGRENNASSTGRSSSNIATIVGSIIGSLVGAALIMILLRRFSSKKENVHSRKENPKEESEVYPGVRNYAEQSIYRVTTGFRKDPPNKEAGSLDEMSPSIINPSATINDTAEIVVEDDNTLVETSGDNTFEYPAFLECEIKDFLIGKQVGKSLFLAKPLSERLKKSSLPVLLLKKYAQMVDYEMEEKESKSSYMREVILHWKFRTCRFIVPIVACCPSPMCILLKPSKYGDLFQYTFAPTTKKSKVKLVRFLIDAALALKELHQSRVTHCNLQTKSFFVDEDENRNLLLQLTEFGQSRAIEYRSPLMDSRILRVNIMYACPEAIQESKGRRPTDFSDCYNYDLYSLGSVLYELITRAKLWQAPVADNISSTISTTGVSSAITSMEQ